MGARAYVICGETPLGMTQRLSFTLRAIAARRFNLHQNENRARVGEMGLCVFIGCAIFFR